MNIETVDNYFNNMEENIRIEILRRSSPVSNFLYKLIEKNQFRNILEIGTFKGRNTAYMSAAAKKYGGIVTTINISQDEMDVAKNIINEVGLNNVNYIVGDSIDILKNSLNDEIYDLVFIDGNHSYKYSYTEYLLVSKNMENGLIIFDDAIGVHSDSKGDGGLPRTIKTSGATLKEVSTTTIGYKVIGKGTFII